ncbi:MAG: hypothetical protein SVX43_15730 [Cyanobacteriota bacterium]|nr:hypothetical protein [Cyanobacteriota bacterium]
MARIVSQFGGLMLLFLLPLIASLPSHAHGSEPHHRPERKVVVSDETTSSDPDTMMSDDSTKPEMSESEISDAPAIAEESNPVTQPTSLQTAGIMPRGLGETLSVLLVAVPAGLYALKHRP